MSDNYEPTRMDTDQHGREWVFDYFYHEGLGKVINFTFLKADDSDYSLDNHGTPEQPEWKLIINRQGDNSSDGTVIHEFDSLEAAKLAYMMMI